MMLLVDKEEIKTGDVETTVILLNLKKTKMSSTREKTEVVHR
jgi:hypothetical protein